MRTIAIVNNCDNYQIYSQFIVKESSKFVLLLTID